MPDGLVDWLSRPFEGGSRKAAHPNARLTVAARQCPVIADKWEDPAGVPIDAILFGGRRASTIPLVTEVFHWTPPRTPGTQPASTSSQPEPNATLAANSRYRTTHATGPPSRSATCRGANTSIA